MCIEDSLLVLEIEKRYRQNAYTICVLSPATSQCTGLFHYKDEYEIGGPAGASAGHPFPHSGRGLLGTSRSCLHERTLGVATVRHNAPQCATERRLPNRDHFFAQLMLSGTPLRWRKNPLSSQTDRGRHGCCKRNQGGPILLRGFFKCKSDMSPIMILSPPSIFSQHFP